MPWKKKKLLSFCKSVVHGVVGRTRRRDSLTQQNRRWKKKTLLFFRHAYDSRCVYPYTIGQIDVGFFIRGVVWYFTPPVLFSSQIINHFFFSFFLGGGGEKRSYKRSQKLRKKPPKNCGGAAETSHGATRATITIEAMYTVLYLFLSLETFSEGRGAPS